MLPSTDLKASAPRTIAFTVLISPAHPYRYRRFACPLTGTDARLADETWIGYSFVPEDFHLLPSASSPGTPEPCLNLSAHTALPMQPLCGEQSCSVHRGPPVAGCPDIRNCIGHPLRSSPITGPSPLLRGGPPLCPASVLSRSRGLRLRFSLRIGATGSHVPHKSQDRVLAAFMPDAARTVNRCPPDSSRDNDYPPVLTSSLRFRHVISGSLAFNSAIHT